MDEILASIRRIIESGEERTPVGTQDPADDDAKPTAAEMGSAQPVLQRPSLDRPDAETSRPGVHYLPSALGETPRDDDERAWGHSPELRTAAPLDPEVADIDVEAMSQVHPDSGQAMEDFVAVGSVSGETGEEPSAAPRAGNENASRPDGRPVSNQAASPADFAFEFDDEQFEADLRSGGWEEQGASRPAVATARETETKVPQPANSQDRRMPESVIDGASALLSTEAGDQVAAAFGDLARTIREGHMRSMEEMAREMMRPMLQEWLDDNLPRIVERLVREEIERVARGARY